MQKLKEEITCELLNFNTTCATFTNALTSSTHLHLSSDTTYKAERASPIVFHKQL